MPADKNEQDLSDNGLSQKINFMHGKSEMSDFSGKSNLHN